MIRLGLVAAMLERRAPSVVPFAQARDWAWHPMWGFWGPWGIAMMLIFWGVVLVGVVVGIRWLVRQGQGARSDPAMDTLRQRYARGEINQDEFETKKRDLAS
jgi:putative membrane protein